MIAVIADDFTGAAEIGGVSLQYGLKATLVTSLAAVPETDVLIVATNTRAQSSSTARKTIHQLTEALLKLQPAFIYKKIDSVMRGHVADELLEQLAVAKKQRALIIPANPSLHRIVRDGVYYCEEMPLNRSAFSVGQQDEKSSHVIDLMGLSGKQTQVIS
ncbi:MAG: hypothetical protein EOO68_05735, partial [Moraxellaceae bacterium]